MCYEQTGIIHDCVLRTFVPSYNSLHPLISLGVSYTNIMVSMLENGFAG